MLEQVFRNVLILNNKTTSHVIDVSSCEILTFSVKYELGFVPFDVTFSLDGVNYFETTEITKDDVYKVYTDTFNFVRINTPKQEYDFKIIVGYRGDVDKTVLCELCNTKSTVYYDTTRYIYQEDEIYYLVLKSESSHWDDYNDCFEEVECETEIKYCPDCGRKL